MIDLGVRQVSLAWLSIDRGLLICYMRKSENYLAQLQFACALLWYRCLPDPATAFLQDVVVIFCFEMASKQHYRPSGEIKLVERSFRAGLTVT
jgi:hypothetical protein